MIETIVIIGSSILGSICGIAIAKSIIQKNTYNNSMYNHLYTNSVSNYEEQCSLEKYKILVQQEIEEERKSKEEKKNEEKKLIEDLGSIINEIKRK